MDSIRPHQRTTNKSHVSETNNDMPAPYTWLCTIIHYNLHLVHEQIKITVGKESKQTKHWNMFFYKIYKYFQKIAYDMRLCNILNYHLHYVLEQIKITVDKEETFVTNSIILYFP